MSKKNKSKKTKIVTSKKGPKLKAIKTWLVLRVGTVGETGQDLTAVSLFSSKSKKKARNFAKSYVTKGDPQAMLFIVENWQSNSPIEDTQDNEAVGDVAVPVAGPDPAATADTETVA